MKLPMEVKEKAIRLRQEGKTYREIIEEIPSLSKSTLSSWLKNLRLSVQEQEYLERRVKEIGYNARVRAAWTKKLKKQRRIQKIIHDAKNEFLQYINDPFFLIGLTLYWAEGNRKQEAVQFTNSDPVAIKLMLNWLVRYCQITKQDVKIRLYIHKIYADKQCEKFWSKITGIPLDNFQRTIYKPTPHKIKKNPEYKGCVQLRVLRVNLFWRIMGWIEALKENFV